MQNVNEKLRVHMGVNSACPQIFSCPTWQLGLLGCWQTWKGKQTKPCVALGSEKLYGYTK